MEYYHLNADCIGEYNEPIVLKVSTKAKKLVGKMGALVRQHRELERQLINEMSEINKITRSEISDFMSEYDFLVDASQYGTGIEVAKMISKEEFNQLRKKMRIDEEYDRGGYI